MIRTTLAAAAIAVGTALTLAPTATADENGYIDAINSMGVRVENVRETVTNGYKICGYFDQGHRGEAEAIAVDYANHYGVPVPVGRRIVAAAIVELCPWHR